jgi:formate hydrogenlyase subunit 3/multisubunit Na+/H+ antiporter MnhD subunit
VSGPVFLAAFLAITGSPPFAPFFSEFAILDGPPLALLALVLALGLWVPPPLRRLVEAAAALVGGG